MAKEIIAVDIDDVLSRHVEAFIAYSNDHFGTQLTVEDYDEDWIAMWQVNHEEGVRRNEAYHTSEAILNYEHRPEARPILENLKQRYSLQVVTSRRVVIKDRTLQWITKYYEGVFDTVHFAGMWDTVTHHSNSATKAAMCQEIGANYLIDDQTKHVFAAAKVGIEGVLFGNYTWNQAESLPPNVTRCDDWEGVRRYFDV